MKPNAKDLVEAKDAALAYLQPAVKEIMKWFRGEFTVREKADKSPVTIADQKAEEILRRLIGKDFPDFGIIGEEFGNERPEAEWAWTIDPIDGTRSFIRGLPLFGTLLALLHRGEPMMGIVCLPALGETAWAVKGLGTHCNGKRLAVSSETDLRKAFVATADRYCFQSKKRLGLLRKLEARAPIVRTYPDAFGHLLAIRGAVDVMVDPWAYIWDFAPIKILAEEAGGAFINLTTSSSGKQNSISEGTAIVGNPALARKIRGLLLA
jgi:myo-inositol-1(or 4)-monophosphatase